MAEHEAAGMLRAFGEKVVNKNENLMEAEMLQIFAYAAYLTGIQHPGDDPGEPLIAVNRTALAAEKRGARAGEIGHFKVNLLDYGESPLYWQVMDWQFLLPDGTWGPWVSEVKDLSPMPAEREADPKGN